VNAVLVPIGGCLLANTATLVVSVASLWIFSRIIRQLDLRHYKILLMLFAFFPMFWVNAANTMDYTWAMFLILASFLSLLNNRHVVAGLLLGAAVGFRLGSCVSVLPFISHITIERNPRRALWFGLAATASGIAAFGLPLSEYGLSTFRYFRPQHMGLLHIPYCLIYSVGIVPALILIIGLARYGRDIAQRIRQTDGVVITCVAAIASVIILFCFVPQDRTYLMPLFPFLFILLGRIFTRNMLILFTVFALAFGFVKFEVRDGSTVDAVRLRPHLKRGIVLGRYERRCEQMELRERLVPYLKDTFARDEKGALICGFVVGLQQLVANEEFKHRSLPDFTSDVYVLDDGRILVVADTIDAKSYA